MEETGKSSIPRQLDRRCSCFARLSISLFCFRFRDRDFSLNNAVFFRPNKLTLELFVSPLSRPRFEFLYFPPPSLPPTRFPRIPPNQAQVSSIVKRFLNRDKDALITARVIILLAFRVRGTKIRIGIGLVASTLFQLPSFPSLLSKLIPIVPIVPDLLDRKYTSKGCKYLSGNSVLLDDSFIFFDRDIDPRSTDPYSRKSCIYACDRAHAPVA